MSVALEINDTLVESLAPVHLEVLNESHQHNVPDGSESHFKVVIVSELFAGLSLIQRHREMNKLLSTQLSGPVHALALHTYTAEEWAQRGGTVPASPPCRGGMKHQH